MSKNRFGLRISVFNAFLFMGSGVQMPFMPLWLQDRGLPASQIAIIMAAMMGVRVFATPVGTFIADRYRNRRLVIMIASSAAFASYCLLAMMPGFLPVLVTAVIAAALFAPVGPLAEAFAIEGSVRHGLDYGRLRVWSSVSFLAGSLIAGTLLDFIPVWWVIYLIIAAQGIGALVTLVLPADPILHPAGHAPPRVNDIMAFVFAASFLVFLAAVSLGQSSHGMFYAFGSVHWDHLGYGKATIGALWSVGVVAEVLFFAFSRRVVARFCPTQLIVAGIAGGVLRWFLFAISPPLWVWFPAQALHASSFALTHLGTMHYIQQNAPGGMRNTIQGIYAALSSGVLLSSVMWASGPLYGALGGATYFVMMAISLAALCLALVLARISPTDPAAADT